MRRTICAGYIELERTVSDIEYTTGSGSAISNTFLNVVEKRNPYQSKNRRRRPEPTPASVSSPVYNTSYQSTKVKAIC
jgi:hypothetical protein